MAAERVGLQIGQHKAAAQRRGAIITIDATKLDFLLGTFQARRLRKASSLSLHSSKEQHASLTCQADLDMCGDTAALGCSSTINWGVGGGVARPCPPPPFAHLWDAPVSRASHPPTPPPPHTHPHTHAITTATRTHTCTHLIPRLLQLILCVLSALLLLSLPCLQVLL
jgi:hypothetical protein